MQRNICNQNLRRHQYSRAATGKIDRKITYSNHNRIRFRRRQQRPEVTSQCDRLGNESRRPDENGGCGGGSGRDSSMALISTHVLLCRGRFWRISARLTDASASFFEKIFEKNSLPTSVGLHLVPLCFSFNLHCVTNPN